MILHIFLVSCYKKSYILQNSFVMSCIPAFAQDALYFWVEGEERAGADEMSGPFPLVNKNLPIILQSLRISFLVFLH